MTNIPLAVLLAVAASIAFAVGSVVQQRAVSGATDAASATLSGRQLLSLIRDRHWLAGMLLTGLSAVLQVSALLLAPITIVQPLGVLAVPWTILLAARVHRRAVPATVWAATALTLLGTAAFAWVAIATAVLRPTLNDNYLVTGTLVGFGFAAALALLGARGPLTWRCLAWSGAAAVVYGTESGAVKALGAYSISRPWLGSPVFWFLAASIVIGVLLAAVWIQQGYANGPAEIVVGAINAVAPVAGVCYGIAVLGEGARITAGHAVGMLCFAAVAVAGVVLLSRFHPALPDPGMGKVPARGDRAGT